MQTISWRHAVGNGTDDSTPSFICIRVQSFSVKRKLPVTCWWTPNTCTRSACNKFDASSERSAGTDPSLWQFPAVLRRRRMAARLRMTQLTRRTRLHTSKSDCSVVFTMLLILSHSFSSGRPLIFSLIHFFSSNISHLSTPLSSHRLDFSHHPLTTPILSVSLGWFLSNPLCFAYNITN